MDPSERFEILSRTFSNPTKWGIILLLLENYKMTVTQMEEYLGVSRSNIYHFTGQMLSDGILNEPEIVPKKNYVEKYYTLNVDMLEFKDEDWEVGFNKMGVDELRLMLSSALLGYSMDLKSHAERLSKASDEEILELKDWLGKAPTSLLYSTMSPQGVEEARRLLNNMTGELVESSKKRGKQEGKDVAKLIVVFLPFLKRKIP